MKNYRRESSFSIDVVSFLRARDFFVQRIESGKTGKGIPDIYWCRDGESGWLELKRVKQAFMGTTKGIVWQPGQQAWQLQHNRKTPTCHTLIAYTDCYVLLTIDKIYEDGEPLVTYESGRTLKEVLL